MVTELVGIHVVFTDLVGSTEMSSRLGPEATEELRLVHFGLLRGAMEAHGGREVKNLGDGLMIVYPSLGAALDGSVAMQQAIERHNSSGKEPLGRPGRALDRRRHRGGRRLLRRAGGRGRPPVRQVRRRPDHHHRADLADGPQGRPRVRPDRRARAAGRARAGAVGRGALGARAGRRLRAPARAAQARHGLRPGRTRAGVRCPDPGVQVGRGRRAAGHAPGRRARDRQDPAQRRAGGAGPRPGRDRALRPLRRRADRPVPAVGRGASPTCSSTRPADSVTELLRRHGPELATLVPHLRRRPSRPGAGRPPPTPRPSATCSSRPSPPASTSSPAEAPVLLVLDDLHWAGHAHADPAPSRRHQHVVGPRS